MKNIIGLLLVIVVGFTSCEGRRTNSQSLSKSITEFNNKNTIEQVTYIPKIYNEIVTDTLLSNGFRVKIKTFSDMENDIITSYKKENVSHKTHYREHIGALEVYYNNRLIAETYIDKSLFFDDGQTKFWNSSVLKSVNLNFFNSLDDELLINVAYCIPESDNCKEFIVSVDTNGNYTTEEVMYKSN